MNELRMNYLLNSRSAGIEDDFLITLLCKEYHSEIIKLNN